MPWSLTLASLALVSALSQQTPLAEGPPPPSAAQAEASRPPGWLLSVRVVAPVTTTDPQHVTVAGGLAHSGAYRMAVQYQPSDVGRLGLIHTSLGLRVINRPGWQLAFDLEHSQARPVRRLFRGRDWELDGHERHQLSIGMASVRWHERRFFGLVDEVEFGYGRMHIWRLVSARAGSVNLGDAPDPILESAAPVGIVGLRLGHRLLFGLEGQAHVRVIGAGRSRGGEVPFAHLTADWAVSRQIFQSRIFGRGSLGVVGNHATNYRAVAYFQHGLGVAFRVAF